MKKPVTKTANGNGKNNKPGKTATKKPAVKKPAKKKAAKRSATPRHPKLFGGQFSVSSILRAMGKRGGFTADGAVAALRKVSAGKVKLEVSKVRSRLWRGANKLGAAPASLSNKDWAVLKK